MGTETEAPFFECDLCGERFETEADLEAHVRSIGIVD
jgi:hypothetical protein